MPERQPSAPPVVSTPEAYGPDLPTRADLDAATAATQAVLDNPHASAADVIAVAEIEEATLLAYALRPGAVAELQAGI